ncbi:MAG TPA: T9SS type A sorting domain-containing protein [Chitinophagaceae bacterium]|nr:T9SS type A sorting domain-containing protein [Chitinophagaceae bacterium]
MKTNFTYYILTVFLLLQCSFLTNTAKAQNCSSISITTTSSESRCISTGSINIRATGGSGNYNYKAEGPVVTPFTSSNVITGLEPGTYKVIVKDVAEDCEVSITNVVVSGSYQDPRFQLLKTNVSCAGNDGTISIDNFQYGRSPFTYTIIAPSPSHVGLTNTSGSFNNLLPGEYAVQLRDSCGGIQVRRVTIENYSWWFDKVALTKTSCTSLNAVITLKDSWGNYNNSSSSFNNFSYGYVTNPGDTTWMTPYNFTFSIGKKRSGVLVAKDGCGKIIPISWNVTSNDFPSVSSTVNTGSLTCTTFIPTITGQQNLTNPSYCLYEASNPGTPLQCNTNGIFTPVAFGSYCIRIVDNCYDTTITRCFTRAKPVPSVGLTLITNRTCSTFTASVSGQTNLTSPTYCLHNAADVEMECNSTGVFTSLPYGNYTIKVKNGCLDTTILRTFSAGRLIPTLIGVTQGQATCTTFTATVNGGANLIAPVEYCLYDDDGNKIACNTTGIFTGVNHGNFCVQAVTACNDSSNVVCFGSIIPKPQVDIAVDIDPTCTDFSATITGRTNLVNPTFFLVNSTTNTQVSQNQTGMFTGIPYGSYCINIKDGCYDTTIVRCFTATRPVPSIGSSILQTASACSTFTATVTGSNLTSPTYIVINAANARLDSNSTGVFTNLPYGSYCFEIKDGCIDTTMRRCATFSLNKTLTVTTTKTCDYGNTTLLVNFASINPPFNIFVYHPSGSLVYSTTTNNPSTSVSTIPGLSPGLQYKVKGVDNCGNADSVLITPETTKISRTISVKSKCPSSTWQDGSGDMSVTCSSNLYNVSPSIIKKDGVLVSLSYSSNTGNNYVFSDLGPGSYIVRYTMQNCGNYQYDTVTVAPYAFPNQNKSAVYQCNDGSFTLSADVTGGVGPYEYEIIGSQPETPSIIAAKQSGALFVINNGTTYSLIRLRTIDACGNAALNDVSVLPLQNIAIQSNSTCVFNEIRLTVDTIPNAVYSWYKKRSATDSTLLTNDLSYHIPFMHPSDIGTYVCKLSVNDECLTRLSYFELTGDCGHITLPAPVQLQGKKLNGANQLNWESKDPLAKEFVIERKSAQAPGFNTIGIVKSNGTGHYSYTDRQVTGSNNQYRVKTISRYGGYSNIIILSGSNTRLNVFPNPVTQQFFISEAGNVTLYDVMLINSAGQVIYSELWNTKERKQYIYKRTSDIKAGMYLLKIVNKADGTTTVHKLVFE